jgi:hypothetical protein
VYELRAFEVHCPRCKTSFAVGTKRCIHCGGPLGGRGGLSAALAAAAPGELGDDDEAPDLAVRRSPLGILAALLMLVMMGVQYCVRQGQ